MPNPATGDTALSQGSQLFKYTLYTQDYVSSAAPPDYKLGSAEPVAPWVRQGRLSKNQAEPAFGKAQFLTIRAGFAGVVQKKVLQQAEDPMLNLQMDEYDPDVIAKILGTTATSLSSGAYTGQSYVYKAGTYYHASVLLVGTEVSNGREEQLFLGDCIITFVPQKVGDVNGLAVEIGINNFSSTETIRYNQWD